MNELMVIFKMLKIRVNIKRNNNNCNKEKCLKKERSIKLKVISNEEHT